MTARNTYFAHLIGRPCFVRTGLVSLALLACVDAEAVDCTISTTGVAFGVYDAALASPTDATGDLRVRCIHLGGGAVRTSYTVGLSAGNSGDFTQRRMRAGTAVLNYDLFDSATRTRVWGNGTGGSGLVSGSLLVNPGNFSVNELSHPIYGRIPAQQSADAGNYSDTILVTIAF